MNNDTTCRAVTCDQSVAERPRYYARQLITSDDLTLEQDYFRSKLRLHNRLLHGWGVVCGAEVCSVPKANSGGNTNEREPWIVMVCPGYVLGPYGDEIFIDCKRKVDLRTRGVVGVTGEPCTDVIDPWCSEVYEEREITKLYVAVRYKQIATRPVRVQPVGCGCDDSRCENSRWRDGYEIGILTAWPKCDVDPPAFEDIWKGELAECTPCPEEPWVVLAKAEVDANGGVTINNCACRRLVVSFSSFWLTCTEGAETHESRKVDEYGAIDFEKEEKPRLNKFAELLQNEPRAQAYIIGYAPAPVDAGTRADAAKAYLVSARGVNPERITLLSGTLGVAKTELYIAPPGTPPPTPITMGPTSPNKDRVPAEPPTQKAPEVGPISKGARTRLASRKQTGSKSKSRER